MAKRPSINFRQHCVRPGVFPSTSINFLCGQESFCQLPSTFRVAGDLLSTFCAIGRPISVKCFCGWTILHQLSLRLAHLPSTSVNVPCGRENFRQPPSTFHAARNLMSIFNEAGRTSVNFLYAKKTFRQLSCGRETFRSFPSTLRAVGKLSINLCQHFVRPEDAPSTFRMSGRPSVNFRQRSIRQWYLL